MTALKPGEGSPEPVRIHVGGALEVGARWVITRAQENPGSRIAIVAWRTPTTRAMFGAILSESSNEQMPYLPEWRPAALRMVWPNGSQAFGFYTEGSPHGDEFRGCEFSFAWCATSVPERLREALRLNPVKPPAGGVS